MAKRNWKKAFAILAGTLLLLIVGVVWRFYQQRKRYLPEVKKVTYLKANLVQGKAQVQAGIRMQNNAPFSVRIDSVSYRIRSEDELLGWGNQIASETLPAFGEKDLDFRLFLNTKRVKKHLTRKPGRDSLALDVALKVYFKPPFLEQQTLTLNKSLKTKLSEGPAFKIDTFFVKSFSPEAGYTFQLDLNTGKTGLPNLEISDLNYRLRLSDSILLSGRIDSTFRVQKSGQVVSIPIHVQTTDLLGVLLEKPGKNNRRKYEASATATVKASRHLFSNTSVSVSRSGTFDLRKLGSDAMALPSIKQVRKLQLVPQNKQTRLQADLLVFNPTKLPLYLDSARYTVRSGGMLVASGGNDLEKVLPATGDQQLQLDLTVNNFRYRQLQERSRQQKQVLLDVEVLLHYNQKTGKPQQFAFRKRLNFPLTQRPTFEFADIAIRELDPAHGARLMVKLKVRNPEGTTMQLEDLEYNLLLKNAIEINGKTREPIVIAAGTSEVEIPVNLSGTNVNQITSGLIQGVESWDYAFKGKATVSVPNTLLHQTEVSVQTKGVYEIKSKGTPDYMPEISKIDTLQVTIHTDTAWVNMYAAIYNTLPVTVHLSELQVDIVQGTDTIGKSEEKPDIYLKPDTNTFAWHTFGIDYGAWEKQVKKFQGQDSIPLRFPTSLGFDLANLGRQQVQLDLKTRIPTPVTPVTVLKRLKFRKFSFKEGLRFDALIAIQNANSEGLSIKDIEYRVTLDNGVTCCGKVNRTYTIPIGKSEAQLPVNLTVWNALKLLKRQLLGPHEIGFQLNAAAQVSTANPKLRQVYVVFENRDKSTIGGKKTTAASP